MRTFHGAGAGIAAALIASFAPALALAQEAAAPVTQEMNFTPVLLGFGAVVLVILAFFLIRGAMRRGGAARPGAAAPSGSRYTQK